MRVAIISAGSMGSAVARVMAALGATVLTPLDGRSAATRARADEAGMIAASPEGIAEAEILLSIVPPGAARALAQSLAPALSAAKRKPLYIDCNAVSPETAAEIASTVAATGARFADCGIIGGPPKTGAEGPTFYITGDDSGAAMKLSAFGLKLRAIDGGIGAASALKMSYAGITKGLTAIGASMALAASRAGLAEALRRELEESQPALLAWLTRQVPGMFPRAYRWVAEMEQIAAFADEDAAAQAIYRAAASFYDRIAADRAANGPETALLEQFFRS
jgi:3-hydroxyisobutyrate dehydrogenase-like beta-hydroxyacid dehydrogenase